MNADEFDKVWNWLYDPNHRLRCFASWMAALGLIVVTITYGALTLKSGADDDYSGHCTYEKNGTTYFQPKGWVNEAQRGVCSGDYNLVRTIDPGMNAGVIKYGLPITFFPVALALLNAGLLGFRVGARKGLTSVKSSALRHAVQQTLKRRETESRMAKLEAQSLAAERDTERLQERLDKLLKS